MEVSQRPFGLRVFCALLVLAASVAPSSAAIDIVFDYSLDSSGFFSGANIARRALLDEAARVFETQLGGTTWGALTPSGTNHLSLELTNPTTGVTFSLTDPKLSADTLIIYIGARDLEGPTLGLATTPGNSTQGTQAWVDMVSAKNSSVRFEPMGGTIAFDNVANWYFDPTPATVEAFAGKYDFLSVAQHEIGHLLGFTDASKALVAQTTAGGFTGSRALALYKTLNPDATSIPLGDDASHWADGLKFDGKQLCMTPSLPVNTRTPFAPLDFAVLGDMGYALTGSTAVLTAAVNNAARGSIEAPYAGTTTQLLGAQLSFKATAKTGSLFRDWTVTTPNGTTTSTVNPLPLGMVEGLQVTANFIPLPFTAGSYYGAFGGGSTADTQGRWKFTVGGLGAVTGTLFLDGRTLIVRGALSQQGTLTVSLLNKSAALVLEQVALGEQDAGVLSGTLTVGDVTAGFQGKPLPVYTAAAPCPQAGNYTVGFFSEAETGAPATSPEPPRGNGWATLLVRAAGSARISGVLADGTLMVLEAPLNADGDLILSHVLTGKLETLRGSLGFPAQTEGAAFDGGLEWKRTANTRAAPRAWNEGFDTVLSTYGHRWRKPVAGQRILPALSASGGVGGITLSIGVADMSAGLLFSDKHVVSADPQVLSEVEVSVSINAFSGQFSGNFLDTSTAPNVRRLFRGVFLPGANTGTGFFLKPGTPVQSGVVYIGASGG